MQVIFWGVRGSIPSPITNKELKKAPTFTYGGNTPCVEVRFSEEKSIIFDAGSGIRVLGNNAKQSEYHIAITHVHWDHIQGIPFFKPLYDPTVSIKFYHPTIQIKHALEKQQRSPFFPIDFFDTPSHKTFIKLKRNMPIFDDVVLDYIEVPHTNKSYAYSITHAGKRIVYMTDYELPKVGQERIIRRLSNFLQDAELAIMDSQFSFIEMVDEKLNWGHSTTSVDIDLCLKNRVKRLVLFHHDPDDSDEVLRRNETYARQYYKRVRQYEGSELDIITSYEGLILDI